MPTPTPSAPPYVAAGPYAAGVTTLGLGDREVEVWYPVARGNAHDERSAAYRVVDWLPDDARAQLTNVPDVVITTAATRDLPAARRGPFHVVVFLHGYGGFRDQSTFLTSHLATWGFVVVAPDFTEQTVGVRVGTDPAGARDPDEVIDASIAAVRDAAGMASGPLSGAVAATGRVALVGHSAGATTAIRYATQHAVATYVALAGADRLDNRGVPESPPADVPSLYVVGADDPVGGPDRVDAYFAAVPPPKRMAVIGGTGHLNAMTDLCSINPPDGEVPVDWLQLPPDRAWLGSDGCDRSHLPSSQVRPIVQHLVVAQLRWSFQLDPQPVGLDARTARSFAPREVLIRG